MLAFPMGEMRMIKGSGDYGTIIKADQIGGSEYSFAEMDGMVFAGEEGAIAMTRWTEGSSSELSKVPSTEYPVISGQMI